MKNIGIKSPKKSSRRVRAGRAKRSIEQRREDFVEAYLSNGGNSTAAAIAAGYSESGANKQGSRMSRDVHILSMLDKRRDAVFDNLKITTERILLERARLAFFDPRKLLDAKGNPIPLQELDDDTAAAIAGLEVMQVGGDDSAATVKKYRLADKNASLTSLEKQRGMYREDNEQSRPVTKVVIVPPKRSVDD